LHWFGSAAASDGLQTLMSAVPSLQMERTRDVHNIALGKAIRQLRKGAGLTQQALADRAEVTVEELRRIEIGAVDADWGSVRRLAYALDKGLPEVFRLTEEMEAGQGEG
jgi:DNA-binding XRE family transcriptional regulator